MNFTIHKNLKINNKVLSDLEFIKSKLIKEYPNKIESLILVGGFGRGEGTVLIKDSIIKIVNDYDIIIIVKSFFFNTKELANISQELAKQLQIRFIDLGIMQYQRVPFLSVSMFNYDCKYGGYVFYGNKKILNRYPNYKKGIIPERQGEILLFNRIIALFELIEIGVLEGNITKDLTMSLQIGKSILACCDYLIIKEGYYACSYKEKLNLLKKIDIEDKYIKLVENATNLKLDPNFSKINYNLDDYLKLAVDLYLFTLSKLYNLKEIDINEIIKYHNKRSFLLCINNLLKIKYSKEYYLIENDVLKLIKSYLKKFNTFDNLCGKYKFSQEINNLKTFISLKNIILKKWLQIHH